VLQYSPSGQFLDSIDMPPSVVGIGDLDVRGDELFVLDAASGVPKVLRIETRTGSITESYDVPKEYSLASGLSGIATGDAGEILLELSGGATLVQLVDARGQSAVRDENGYRAAEHSLRVSGFEASIGQGSMQVSVEVPHAADRGGAVVLSTNAEGFYLVVEEAALVKGTFVVDQLVRRFSWEGEPIEVGRAPLEERLFFVPHGVAVGPDGGVVALVPRLDRLDVVELSLATNIEPILIGQDFRSPADSDVGSIQLSPRSCVSRYTMANTFHPYWNNYKYLSSTNINGSCPARTKPRYLSTPNYYASVSYDWGGFDTVSSFNGYMYPGTEQAGDISSKDGGSDPCSRGVDCSGLVSRVWQQTDKFSTRNLDDISNPVTGSMLAWDIFLKYDNHTALFVLWYGSGMYIGEATTANSYDRVVYRYVPTSWANGYEVRRYWNVCP
jgi:hypothetical protein